MELKTFNAWGMVSIKANVITVILSAVSPGGKPYNRTLKDLAKGTQVVLECAAVPAALKQLLERH